MKETNLSLLPNGWKWACSNCYRELKEIDSILYPHKIPVICGKCKDRIDKENIRRIRISKSKGGTKYKALPYQILIKKQ